MHLTGTTMPYISKLFKKNTFTLIRRTLIRILTTDPSSGKALPSMRRHFCLGKRKFSTIRIATNLTALIRYKRNNADEIQNPRDIVTLKHFIKFVALSMKGRQTQDNSYRRPTVDSVRAVARRFISSYNRKHRDETPIPFELRYSITAVSIT